MVVLKSYCDSRCLLLGRDLEALEIGGFFAGTCVCFKFLFHIDESSFVLRTGLYVLRQRRWSIWSCFDVDDLSKPQEPESQQVFAGDWRNELLEMESIEVSYECICSFFRSDASQEVGVWSISYAHGMTFQVVRQRSEYQFVIVQVSSR